jgi:TonB family protein
MSSAMDVGKKLEGRIIDGKFPLGPWLGESAHSSVYLTKLNDGKRAAIKLISPADYSGSDFDSAAQLSRWAEIAKLSHPHLIRLFDCGRGEIEGIDLLYVVMEYAEENLAQILPQRPLSREEVAEMLSPTADALSFIHQAGFVHGRIKPSNILAADNSLKVSSDSLRKPGERDPQALSTYTAPEAATALSPAADVWSLGAMLVAVFTQREPQPAAIEMPESIPQPYRRIAERCLRVDPQQRCTVDEILKKPEARSSPPQPTKPSPAARIYDSAIPEQKEQREEKRSKAPLFIILAIVFAVLVLAVFLARRPHESTDSSQTSSTRPANAPAPPFASNPNAAGTSNQSGVIHGKVLRQVSPEVSAGARRTITGHVKVAVQISVDSSGNVTEARLASAGPSRYFANQALAAARGWKFQPPQVDGQPSPSQWMLRFQFGRASTEVSPSEIKP